MTDVTRRSLLHGALTGSALYLAFAIGGETLYLTPQEARSKGVPLRALTDAQAETLGLLGETIVPGSARLGLVQFLDHQLQADPNDALLIAKYFGVALPYIDFYAAGARIADAMAQRTARRSIAKMTDAELIKLVERMSKPGAIVDGYPIFLFYLCLRSDAVDVVYGTPDGFRKLNIPYMQHILPPKGWNG
jgi:hypothetical protein